MRRRTSVAVPKSCIQNGLLILDFEYPDAVSTYSLGLSENDERLIAIHFKQILFEEQEETDSILFGKDSNASDFFYGGWNAIGEHGACWTNETASLIATLPGESSQRMEVTYTTNPAAGDTSVYYNDEYIGTLPYHDGHTTEEILLPAQYRSDTGAQMITFVTDGATTYDGRVDEDERILGVHVSKIHFAEVKEAETILFTENGNAGDFFYDGWNAMGENGACWTNETANLIAALPGGSSQRMEITYTTNPAAGDTSVYYNDEYIGTLPYHDGHTTEEILLPSQYRSDTDAQIITFVTDGATTYAGRVDGDKRILGVHVSKIHFTNAQE